MMVANRPHVDGQHYSPGGTAIPLEFVARAGTETSGLGHSLGDIYRLCRAYRRYCWAHRASSDRRLHPCLCDGNVRERLDHRNPPVRPVFNSAFARAPGDRKRLPLYGPYSHPVESDVPGYVRCEGIDRWAAEYVSALSLLARWIRHFRNRVCLVKGHGSPEENLAGRGRFGDCRKCRFDCSNCCGGGFAIHGRRTAMAPRCYKLIPFQPAVALLCRGAHRNAL